MKNRKNRKFSFTKWLNYDMLWQNVQKDAARLLSFGTKPMDHGRFTRPALGGRAIFLERWNSP